MWQNILRVELRNLKWYNLNFLRGVQSEKESEIKPPLKDESTKQTAISLRNSTVFDNKCKGSPNLLLIH